MRRNTILSVIKLFDCIVCMYVCMYVCTEFGGSRTSDEWTTVTHTYTYMHAKPTIDFYEVLFSLLFQKDIRSVD